MPANKPVRLPADLATVSAVFDGTRWLYGIVPGSITEDDETNSVTFEILWSGKRRRIMLSRNAISGIELSPAR